MLELTATKAEIIELLGINGNTLTNYLNDGLKEAKVGSGRNTKYVLKRVVEFHIMRRVEQSITALKGDSLELSGIPAKEVSEQIIYHWKAEEARNKAMVSHPKMIPIETSKAEINHALAQIRGALDTIPGAWAPFMVEPDTLEAAERALAVQLQDTLGMLEALPMFEADEMEIIDNESDEYDDTDNDG